MITASSLLPVRPAVIPQSGHVSVTLTGTNLPIDVSAVTLSGIPAVTVDSVSATQIVVTAASAVGSISAGALGSVTVNSTSAGLSNALANSLYYGVSHC